MTDYLIPAFWIWMAAQLPLAIFFGACIRAGRREEGDVSRRQESPTIPVGETDSPRSNGELPLTPTIA